MSFDLKLAFVYFAVVVGSIFLIAGLWIGKRMIDRVLKTSMDALHRSENRETDPSLKIFQNNSK